MGILALKCPNCHGDICLDDAREFGFCQYCGTKIMIQRDVNNISINISMREQVANQMTLLRGFYDAGRYEDALQVFEELHAMNALDAEAWRIGGYSKMRVYGPRMSMGKLGEVEQCLSRYAILAGVEQPDIDDCLCEMYPDEWARCRFDDDREMMEKIGSVYASCESVDELRPYLGTSVPSAACGNGMLTYRIKAALIEGDASAVEQLVKRIGESGGLDGLRTSISSDDRLLELSRNLDATVRIVRDRHLAHPDFFVKAYHAALSAEECGHSRRDTLEICESAMKSMVDEPFDPAVLRGCATSSDMPLKLAMQHVSYFGGILGEGNKAGIEADGCSGHFEGTISEANLFMYISTKVPDVIRLKVSVRDHTDEFAFLVYSIEEPNAKMCLAIDRRRGLASIDPRDAHRVGFTGLRPGL